MLYRSILFALLSVLFVGCRDKTNGVSAPLINVEVESVSYDSISNKMSFVGVVTSDYDLNIEPRVNGYLSAINYSEGDVVKKGDVIYTIEPNEINTQVLISKANLASAKAKLIEAENNYKRAVPLAKINAISQSSLDQYEANYKSARANLLSAESQLDNSQINYNYTIIKSPINGVVGNNDLAIGQYVGPSTSYAKLVTISNIDHVEVNISIPLTDYFNILNRDNELFKSTDDAPQQTMSLDDSSLLTNIEMYLPNGSRYPLEGRYDYTQKNINSSTGSVVIVVKFENIDNLLRPGQNVAIKTDVGHSMVSILVPQVAVVQSQGINGVWVIDKDSVARFRQVKLGDVYGDKWIVKSGINEGDRVAVSSIIKLRDGEKVNIVKSKK